MNLYTFLGWEYYVMASLSKNMNFKLVITPPPNGTLWGENKNGTFTGYCTQKVILSLMFDQHFRFGW